MFFYHPNKNPYVCGTISLKWFQMFQSGSLIAKIGKNGLKWCSKRIFGTKIFLSSAELKETLYWVYVG
jgi:hypothetical protein